MLINSPALIINLHQTSRHLSQHVQQTSSLESDKITQYEFTSHLTLVCSVFVSRPKNAWNLRGFALISQFWVKRFSAMSCWLTCRYSSRHMNTKRTQNEFFICYLTFVKWFYKCCPLIFFSFGIFVRALELCGVRCCFYVQAGVIIMYYIWSKYLHSLTSLHNIPVCILHWTCESVLWPSSWPLPPALHTSWWYRLD